MSKRTPAQTDLFAAPAPAAKPAPPTPARRHFPTPLNMAWARELTAAGDAGHDVTFLVDILWTGVVVESLQLGADRRLLLYKDGSIHEIKPDSGAHGRCVFLHAERALDLHKTHPLIPVSVGDVACRYRFAADGERADPVLELPRKYGEP